MKPAPISRQLQLSGLKTLAVVLAWGCSFSGLGTKTRGGDFSSPFEFRLQSGSGLKSTGTDKPVSPLFRDCCLATSPDPPRFPVPAPAPAPAPAPSESADAASKADESTPAAENTPVEPVRKHDGGVPAEAAEFHGTVTGCVETIGWRRSAFRLKITAVSADAASKARKPESLISAVVLIIEGTDRSPDGKFTVQPGHHEWIATLQPGNLVVVPVRYTKTANGFKMTSVPLAPIVPGTCGGAAAPAPAVPVAPPPPD